MQNTADDTCDILTISHQFSDDAIVITIEETKSMPVQEVISSSLFFAAVLLRQKKSAMRVSPQLKRTGRSMASSAHNKRIRPVICSAALRADTDGRHLKWFLQLPNLPGHN